ncbi:hypothetical protein LCGC14_2583170 [marine sediment metagenome]|uniref:Uncharacterized protein n=1 Tax=marine sediment metagenome TaxID=412755 RepID=A0A0F9D6N0_9ZZZZ
MKSKQTDSGLIVFEKEEDPTDRPRKRMSLWSLTTTYEEEIKKFIDAIDKAEGKVCACLVIDKHNYWGDVMGKEYAIIYQSEKPVSVEQWT